MHYWRFLNLSTSDILGWITVMKAVLGIEGCLVAPLDSSH